MLRSIGQNQKVNERGENDENNILKLRCVPPGDVIGSDVRSTLMPYLLVIVSLVRSCIIHDEESAKSAGGWLNGDTQIAKDGRTIQEDGLCSLNWRKGKSLKLRHSFYGRYE